MLISPLKCWLFPKKYCFSWYNFNSRICHSSEIKSLGYKNLAIGEKHVNGGGDIRLVCKLKIVKDDSSNHSLSSDLKALINDEKSADVVVEAGGKEFKVHRWTFKATTVFLFRLFEKNRGPKIANRKEKVKVSAQIYKFVAQNYAIIWTLWRIWAKNGEIHIQITQFS